MIYEVRGDTIGTWQAARLVTEPGAGRRLRLEGVRAMGTADQRFVLKRVAPPNVEAEWTQLAFALCEHSGDPLHLNLIARADSWDGFGSGASHIVFDETITGSRIVLDLDGLPRQPETIEYEKPRVPKALRDGAGPSASEIPSVCYCEGTKILTGRGRERVETLSDGDGIWTLDRGIRRLRWTRPLKVRFRGRNDPRRPIRFDPGCLSLDLPPEPVWLAPGHSVLVTGWRAELFFGLPEVLVPAHQLTEWAGIERDTALDEVTYHCLLLDTHEIVNAGGLLCETLKPRDALHIMPTLRERTDICRAVPTLQILDGRLSGPPVRPVAQQSGGSTVYMDSCLV